MNLKHLEYFVEIAEQKSIHKAAEILYNSQPNLSRAIQSLENELGAKLLIRSNQGVELTEIGESVYYYAKSIINQMNSLSRLKLRKQELVQSKLGVSISRFMLEDDLMLRFYETVKSEHTTINVYETTLEETIRQVATLQSEIGIVIVDMEQLPAFHKVLQNRELEMNPIGTSRMYIHASKESRLYQKDKIYMKDLLDYNYIHQPYDFFSNISYASKKGTIRFCDLNKTLTINNYHTMLRMLKYTNAFMFGNRWQIKELEKGKIGSKRIEDVEEQVNLIWIKRKKEILSENAKKFLQLIYIYYAKNSDAKIVS